MNGEEYEEEDLKKQWERGNVINLALYFHAINWTRYELKCYFSSFYYLSFILESTMESRLIEFLIIRIQLFQDFSYWGSLYIWSLGYLESGLFNYYLLIN